MTVLQVHCQYRSGRGGEDSVVDDERQMLENGGHTVVRFFRSNAGFGTGGTVRSLLQAAQAVWSRETSLDLQDELRRLRPDIVHVHNTFGLMSPAVFWAAKAAGVPAVLTLHNYRIVCPNSLLLRHGSPCQRCVGRMPWPALFSGCRYGGSYGAVLCASAIQTVHSLIGTFRKCVPAFIALTGFQKELMSRALPADRIFVKPNCLSAAPCQDSPSVARDRRVVFLGSVEHCKGPDLLLAAWSSVNPPDYRLAMVGDGPEAPELRRRTSSHSTINWLGRLERPAALAEIRRARFLALPSRWFEGLPMVVLEALAQGTPVIVPNHGAFQAIVRDGDTCLMFEPGNAASLSAAIRKACAMDDREWSRMSQACHRLYASRYSREIVYPELLRIYQHAILHPIPCAK